MMRARVVVIIASKPMQRFQPAAVFSSLYERPNRMTGTEPRTPQRFGEGVALADSLEQLA